MYCVLCIVGIVYCVLCIAILKTDKKGFALVFGLGFLSWGEFLRLGVEGGGGGGHIII